MVAEIFRAWRDVAQNGAAEQAAFDAAVVGRVIPLLEALVDSGAACERAAAALMGDFEARRVRKTYAALCAGAAPASPPRRLDLTPPPSVPKGHRRRWRRPRRR